MSQLNLFKGRTQKYIKRIPKAGGGYRYIYKEHHKGGVGAVEHMKEGAAFKLTFGGQEGHFHIIATQGDKITVKHDELHGPDHKGVEMTKAELSELLTREHKPALEADAKKKRERVERMKRETPRHIGLKQAERLAKEAEARLGEERPDNFETMPESEGESPTSPAQSVEDIDAQLEANEPKLSELSDLRFRLKQARKAPPPKADKRAKPPEDLFSGLGASREAAVKQGFKLRKPTEAEARLIEEQQAIFDAPADAKPKPSPELVAIREQYQEAFPEGALKPFKELFMAGVMLEPYTLRHTQASRTDIDTTKLTEWFIKEHDYKKRKAMREAAEIVRVYVDEARKVELYAANALEHSTTDEQRAEINELVQQARQKVAQYIDDLHAGKDLSSRRRSDRQVSDNIRTDLNITRALRELRNKHLEQSLKEAQRQERAILDQNAELRDRKDEIEKQARQPAPDNFETMPESDDYTQQGVALSPKGRAELARATGAAMRAGDRDEVRKLTERADRDNVHTGDEKIDALFNFMFVEGTRKDLPDGGRTVEHSGRLSGIDAKALEDAVKRGVLDVQTAPNGSKVYSLSGERAARSLDSNMTLVTNKGAYTFNYADFSAPNAHEGYPPEQLAEDLIKENDDLPPPKDPAKVNAILDELKGLINENPALAKDPRIAALLGTPEGKEQPKREGREATLFVTGIAGLDPNQKARYKLIEAGDAIASHDPIAFSKRRDYPEGVQERAYHSAKNEQLKVIANAGSKFNPAYLVNTNPDATNGPPILTPEGHALGGNSRVMSLQRVYNQNPEGAKRYKEELKAQAASFGFSAEDIDALEAPMLVRVYDPQEDSTEELRKLVRAMNESKTAGMEGRTEGRALASKLSDNTLKTIKRVLDKAPKDYSLNRFLTKPSKGLDELVGALFRDGIITPESAPKLLRVSDGTLNPQGRDMIQKILVGHVVRDDRILAALDYQTFENLTVVLGKLAAAGLNETQRSALEDAVALYNYATQKDTLKARDSLKDRDDAMRFILEEEQELFSGASAEGLDMEGLKSRTLANPLARGFLQIMVLAPSSKKLENAFDSFIELTEKKEQIDMFAAGPMEYEAAINQLIKELGDKEKLDVRPYGQTKKSINLETALFKHLLRKARARALS